MKALHLPDKWCAIGSVADTITYGDIARTEKENLVKNQVLIEVKASTMNVDDIALCQDSAGGGWFFHGRKPDAKKGKPFIGGMDGVQWSCAGVGAEMQVGVESGRPRVRTAGRRDAKEPRNLGGADGRAREPCGENPG
jgi:hypothetical protein